MSIEIIGKTNSPMPIKTPTKAGSDDEKKVAVTITEKNDTVALTNTTQEIKKAISATTTSPVDIDKVNSVKKALADGSYSVNAEKVAKKLVEFEKLFSQENST
jgi:negative regulator of flagellin synthesis FlgM